MGIVDFGNIVKEKYKNVKNAKMPSQVDSVFIDCNGILYGAEASVYLTGTDKKTKKPVFSDEDRRKKYLKGKEALEAEFLNKVIEKLKSAYDEFKPQKNFFIAIDGVANAAKMQQQKTRRFKSIKDKEKIPNPFFSTRAFTPGTMMMVKIDQAITAWLKSNKTISKKVHYSSHLEPGEAEHKIFDYIRKDQYVKGSGAHIIYGADNDLYILTLLCKESNMYLYKDDFKTLYNMNNAKKQTLDFMKFEGCDESKLLVDFSILITFAGNDFLPQFPNISSSIGSLDIVLSIYKQNKIHLHTNDNNINWKGILMLFRKINKHTINKEDLYITGWDLAYPYKEIRDSTIIKNIYGKPVDEVYDSSKHYRSFDLEKFSKLWYNKQFVPRCTKLKKLYKKHKYYDEDDIENMCLQYLQTIQWCHLYYTEGLKCVSNYHFYNYDYLPLTVDIETYLDNLSNKQKLEDVRYKEGEDFNSLEQLMMVLPPQSLNLIPEDYHQIYRDHLNSVNPVDFPELLTEGTDKSYHQLLIIPHIDIELIKYIFESNNIKLPTYMKKKESLIIENKEKIIFDLNISKDYLM